jgi:hypothetical protein
MAANTQFQHIQEVSYDVVDFLRGTYQAAARLLTLQGCYLGFAQNIFRTWIDVFMPRVQTWGQPTQKQQDPSQRLISPQRRSMEGNQSEVAAPRARLDRECEAYNLFCNGFAVTASHTAITTRMRAFSVHVEEIHSALVSLIGDEQATMIIGNVFQEKVI